MWRIYNTACRASDKQTISYQKCIQLWDELQLEDVVVKRWTDLSLMFQQSTSKFQRAAGSHPQ